MDEENNYECDLSESWSLVDINLNEESIAATDAPLTLGVEKCSKTKEIQSLQNLDDYGKNDSGDAESIEILDVDGIYQDSEIGRHDASVIDHFDFPTYQSDDEESSDEKLHNEIKSKSSAVIKRKRKKVNRDMKDTVHCVYRENVCMSDKFRTKNHPVYKHYRNNVANTILNLSVGVIFAGVACIAVGHFLGIQDAAETTLELVETLKKVQVENAALQTNMAHLKTALLNLETNSKLQLPLNQQHNKVSCEETPKISPSITQTQADLNNAALSEICSSLNSIEWLSKLQNAVKKGTETENTEIDINRLEKHIHDQLNLLKEKRKLGAKLSEDTDLLLILKKLLIILKKIMNRLSSSHDNIEVMNEKFLKLKHTINHNLNKFFRDSSRETQHENRVPITELDLKSIQWTPSDSEKNPASTVLYKFPQPQKYYDLETILEPKTSNSSLKKDDDENLMKNRRKHKENEKKKEKKFGKKFKKEKDVKHKKKDKKRRRSFAEKFEEKESEYLKYSNLRPFNESDSSYRRKPAKKTKHKRRVKKIKNSKLKKVLLSNAKKEFDIQKKYVPFCSESQCFNLTGYWVFKWADGREEFRRHQTLGDWQFDRAKARKDVRDIKLNNNWQFERAKARKELRNDDSGENWQFKKVLARENDRNDDRTHRRKFTKYSGKEFLQDRFSWI